MRFLRMADPRKRFIGAFILATIAACATAQLRPETMPPVQARLYADIAYLASRQLEGRLAGTPGNDSAAGFIARRYLQLGLPGPFNGISCGQKGCESSLFQFFRMSAFLVGPLDVPINDMSQNVAAVAIGTDSALRNEYVVVGAHYDHIGRSTGLSLDQIAYHFIHPGADDNASGTAAVLELARRFASQPARRSILFADFSAEEEWMVGSQVFVGNPPVSNDSVVAMLNLDMIGRLRDDKLIAYTGLDHDRFRTIVDSVEKLTPPLVFHHWWLSMSREASDHASFAAAHIPVLSFFTDYHPDYHRTTDTVDRINFPGMEKIVDLSERFVRAVADGRDRPGRRD